MKVGQTETITYKWLWKECEECGNPAKWRVTFLDDNNGGCRRNPSSSAYQHDDCSYCSDHEIYTCEKHRRDIERQEPIQGFRYCASFPLKKFKHMGFYKVKV